MKKEVKAAPVGAEGALMRAFEEFKAANDARLEALERKRGDVLFEEKVDRIDRALSEQKSMLERAVLHGRRPGLATDPAVSEHKSAWSAYLRRGDVSALEDYRIASVSARRLDRAEGGVESVDAPLVLEPAAAEAMAQALLSDRRAAAESLDVEVGPAQLALEPGDLVRFDGGATYLIARIEDTEARRMELRRARDATAPDLALPEPAPPSPPADSPTPVLAVLDLPALPGVEDDDRPLAAVFAAPWRGQHEVFAGPEDALMTRRAIVRRAAIMGELVWALWPGPVGRWDRGNRMRVRIFDGALSSASAAAVLAGANVFAIQNGGEWEIVQARDCVLVSDGEYVFSGLLRGQAGSAHAMAAPHPIGARIIKLDERLARLEIGAHEWREALPFAAPPSGALPSDARAARSEIILPHAGLRPRAPAHLRARKLTGGDIRLSWVRCARIGGDAWGPGEPSLGFGAERYRVEVQSGVIKRMAEVSVPSWTYSAAAQAEDFGAPPGSLHFRVAQIDDGGRPGLNKELTITL